MKQSKRVRLLYLLLIGIAEIHAQGIGYAYDAAGNRISREVVMAQSKAATDDESAASVAEVFRSLQVQVTPDPVTGKVDVSIAGATAEELSTASVTAYTAGGVRILSSVFLPDGHCIVNLGSHRPAGVYILYIRCGEYNHSWRVIKK